MTLDNHANPPIHAGEPLARSGHFEADDPFLHEEAVRPMAAICTPLGRHYRFGMDYLATPRMPLYRESVGARLRARGFMPPGMLSLCVRVRISPNTTFGKAPLPDSGMPCILGGLLDVVLGEGQCHIVVIMELALLRGSLPDECFEHIRVGTNARRVKLAVVIGQSRAFVPTIPQCDEIPGLSISA